MRALPFALVLSLCGWGCSDDPAAPSTAPGSEDAGPVPTNGDAAPDGAAPAPPEFDFTEFDSQLESFLAEQGLPGATAVIVHEDYGVLHERGYGEFSVDRVSLIASSSKVMSVGVLMRLADAGLLDIDAPISGYLQDWGEYKTDLTVAQLLSNSSGLVGLIDNPLYAPYICQYISNGTLESCAEKIYTADDAEDRVPPDTQFRYGGGQWQLAGGIAEAVSGRSWAELVAETYLTPCEMNSTGYTNQYSEAFATGGDLAAGLGYPPFFDGDINDLPQTQNPSIEGGAYTTVADYANVLLLHLRGGLCGDHRVLTEEAVDRMQEDRIGEAYGGNTFDPTLSGYGLGWWVSRDEPGVVADGGAYGAMPWLDVPRGYGALIILEANSGLGSELRLVVKPTLDALFDSL